MSSISNLGGRESRETAVKVRRMLDNWIMKSNGNIEKIPVYLYSDKFIKYILTVNVIKYRTKFNLKNLPLSLTVLFAP